MKITTSILLITLVASMSAHKLRADDGVNTEVGTQETGACTMGLCASCDKIDDAKFCRMCYKSNISGTGNNTFCDGIAPSGCLGTVSIDDEPTCVECDTKNNYHMVSSDCVQCDLSSNYLSGKECKAVKTKVTNCASYKSATDCKSCSLRYQLKENACTKILISNCSAVSPTNNTKCHTCVSGYYVSDDGTCSMIKIANCIHGT